MSKLDDKAAKPKVFYILRKHLRNCWYRGCTEEEGKVWVCPETKYWYRGCTEEEGKVWVCPETKYVDPRRDKTKPRRNRDSFLVYRCNMPECPAELAVRLRHIEEVLGVNRRKELRPR